MALPGDCLHFVMEFDVLLTGTAPCASRLRFFPEYQQVAETPPSLTVHCAGKGSRPVLNRVRHFGQAAARRRE